MIYDADSQRLEIVPGPGGKPLLAPANCTWSRDWHLAAAYAFGTAAIFDEDMKPIWAATPKDSSRGPWNLSIAAWAPDSTYTVLRVGLPSSYFLMDLQSLLTPLELEADRVFDVLPGQ